MNYIIIGGSAAGPKNASRIRRLDPNANIKLFQKEEHLSMASCGYPYYIEGVFDDKQKLTSTPINVPRDPKFFKAVKNIDAFNNHEVIKINPSKKSVIAKNLLTDETSEHFYDKLFIATGAKAIKPNLEGIDLDGVTCLHSINDAFNIKNMVKNAKQAVVIGAGFIGIETAEALAANGIKVSIVELKPKVLPNLDKQISQILLKHLKMKGIDVYLNEKAEKFIGENGKLTNVVLANGTKLNCDIAVVSVGVTPNSCLAKDAGLEIGTTKGIATNQYLQTSDENIFAGGDCIETFECIENTKVLWPMGDAANIQGRIAADNMVIGLTKKYKGTALTGICKAFDLSVGISGFSEEKCKNLNLEYETVVQSGGDKPGFMGAKPIIIKLIAEKNTKRILGMQAIGMGDVSKRIATAAVAIQNGLNLDDLACLDLPYAPPFSPAVDNLITAAYVLENKINGLVKTVSSEEAYTLAKAGKAFVIDVRSPGEHEECSFDIGEKLIPLGALRKKIDMLPASKDQLILIYCKSSTRAYEASRILAAYNYKNVFIIEGGLLAWIY